MDRTWLNGYDTSRCYSYRDVIDITIWIAIMNIINDDQATNNGLWEQPQDTSLQVFLPCEELHPLKFGMVTVLLCVGGRHEIEYSKFSIIGHHKFFKHSLINNGCGLYKWVWHPLFRACGNLNTSPFIRYVSLTCTWCNHNAWLTSTRILTDSFIA